MYNIYGFGKRIASYRKIAGLTQEELASRLGITAQAVSKWENEMSFPELTMLPQLAQVLKTSIEKLFGNETSSSNGAERQSHMPSFPEKRGNLTLVHTLDNVACYADKEVDVTNQDTVVFKDGSRANLPQLEVVNKGTGNICFQIADEHYSYRNIDMNKTEHTEVFDGISSLEVSVVNATYQVLRSTDRKTYINACGSPIFIDCLKITKVDKLVSVKYQNPNNASQEHGGYSNKVEILLGQDLGDTIDVSIIGTGGINVGVPFKSGKALISGSGDISLQDVNGLACKINGSGNVSCNKAARARLDINGSGDIEIQAILEEFSAKINGSGSVKVHRGQVDTFTASINGSGDIIAENITARVADISVKGSGDITLGRVVEESIEKHSRNSAIRILARGVQ